MKVRDRPNKAPIAEAATPPANPAAAPSALRGVLLVMAAVLVFAFGDIATKHLAMRHDVSLVLFGRYAVNPCSSSPSLAPAMVGDSYGPAAPASCSCGRSAWHWPR